MGKLDRNKIAISVSPAGPGQHKWVLHAPGHPELASGVVSGTRAEAFAAAQEAEVGLVKGLDKKDAQKP